MSLAAPMRPQMTVHALAEGQHGLVGRTQLLRLGIAPRTIGRWLAAGRLHEVHRGVYAVGHRRLTQRARWMAAVLAGGPGTVLSHRAAAALWGIRASATVEITTLRRIRRDGIVAHRNALRSDEVTVRDGIPVTTVARTLLDLASVVTQAELEHALNEAEYRGLSDITPLGALVARYPRQRGTATLNRLTITGEVSKEQLERDFLAFLDEHGFPRPRRNHVVEGFLCDCVWPEQRLIVELDGGAHRTTKRFHSDRRRDRKLTIAGWRVIRVTARQLDAELARDLLAALHIDRPHDPRHG
jgi:very-short-patch-repair endonuclease/predicted transcriptional regulator of viral defense system